MDLSFARQHPFARAFGHSGVTQSGISLSGLHVAALPVGLPTELAVLLVGVVSRQATSPTARLQAVLSRCVTARVQLAPDSGAFDAATATALTRWQQE